MADHKTYGLKTQQDMMAILAERLDRIIELMEEPHVQCPTCNTLKPESAWDHPEGRETFYCTHCHTEFEL